MENIFFFVLIFLAPILAQNLNATSTFDVGKIVLYTTDVNPLIASSVSCGDFLTPPESLTTAKYSFSFNSNSSLPSNVEAKRDANNRFAFHFRYPTILNNGEYRCCVQLKDTVCYKSVVTVNENFHYDIRNNDTLPVAKNRDVFLQLFNDSAFSAINCVFKNQSAPASNVLTNVVNGTDLPYYRVYGQVVIQEVSADNFGTYNCTGIDMSSRISFKSFNLVEAAVRDYPWKNDESTNSANRFVFPAFALIFLANLF
uniref:Uncharacterized protein n=1 Tax=Panagrolaimus sp. JU765 TaxID=591449 RepID=A0AC34QU78_9BILA